LEPICESMATAAVARVVKAGASIPTAGATVGETLVGKIILGFELAAAAPASTSIPEGRQAPGGASSTVGYPVESVEGVAVASPPTATLPPPTVPSLLRPQSSTVGVAGVVEVGVLVPA